MAKRTILFFILSSSIAWAGSSTDKAGPFAFPPTGFDIRVSAGIAAGAAAVDTGQQAAYITISAPPKLSLRLPRDEFQTLAYSAIGETDFKFMLIKVELSSKIQNELRKMDPANQSLERQYRFLSERRLARRKTED